MKKRLKSAAILSIAQSHFVHSNDFIFLLYAANIFHINYRSISLCIIITIGPKL